jgi:hypothetical protein
MDRFIKTLLTVGIVFSFMTLAMAQDAKKVSDEEIKPAVKAEMEKAPNDVDNMKTVEKIKKKGETAPQTTSEAKPVEKKTKKEAIATEQKKIATKEKKSFFQRLFGGNKSDNP